MKRKYRAIEEKTVTALAISIVASIAYFYYDVQKHIPMSTALPAFFLFDAVCIFALLKVHDINWRFWRKEQTVDPTTGTTDKPFSPRPFYHRSEALFLPVLRQAVKEVNSSWIIVPKIGLWAAVETDDKSCWNKISQKHIDYGVLDPNANRIVLAVELDGNSHRSPDAIRRDAEKDTILDIAGIPVLRVPVAKNYNVDSLRNDILCVIPSLHKTTKGRSIWDD